MRYLCLILNRRKAFKPLLVRHAPRIRESGGEKTQQRRSLPGKTWFFRGIHFQNWRKPMVTISDVDPRALNRELARELKERKITTPPAWAPFVKTGSHKI